MKCFECGDIGHKRHACPHKAQISEEDVRPSTSAAVESSESVSDVVQHQAVLQRDTDSDGLIENQTEDVNTMVDSGKNLDVSELDDDNIVMNDDAVTVSVERASNEDSEIANSGEMCTDAELEMRDDDTFSDISDIGSQ